jgi:dienelactone hydrolase
MRCLALLLLLILSGCSAGEHNPEDVQETPVVAATAIPEKIQFPSQDSLLITANLYHFSDSAPTIVLCHQARYNKFEYTGIARTLHEIGYNCLAIDQRSGGGLVEEFNETMLEAKRKNKPVEFLDAEQDITAAVNFAAVKYNQKVILWGSSYSSTLALYIAISNPNVKAVISFSPGDYFQDEKGSLQTLLMGFTKPMFVTSSREEAGETTVLLSQMKLSPDQTQFIPDSSGFHGSRALWRTSENNEEYWAAITAFLKKLD